ncbi:MAG: hypothetical protein ACD_41C00197G0002, partial [uncultured bacterium]
MVNHEQKAAIVHHIAITILVAISLRCCEIRRCRALIVEIVVGPEIKAANHPTRLDGAADPAIIGIAPNDNRSRRNVVATKIDTIRSIGNLNLAQWTSRIEIMQVLLFVGPTFGCVDNCVVILVIDHLVRITKGEAGKLDVYALSIDCHCAVVVLRCRSIEGVRIGTVQQHIREV